MDPNQSRQIQGIVNAEIARLNEKEQSYDNLQFGQQRVLELNRNFQERTAAFNWIIVVFFITLAIAIFLLFLDRSFPLVGGVFEFMLVIVLAVGLCYCLWLYVQYSNRDPNDYYQIQYAPPPISPDAGGVNGSVTSQPTDNGQNIGTLCQGASCCGPNTVWNSYNGACIKHL